MSEDKHRRRNGSGERTITELLEGIWVFMQIGSHVGAFTALRGPNLVFVYFNRFGTEHRLYENMNSSRVVS